MSELKFKAGDYIVYIGELNNWTYNVDIKQNDKGNIKSVVSETNGMFYSVKFDSGITASIDSKYLKKIE